MEPNRLDRRSLRRRLGDVRVAQRPEEAIAAADVVLSVLVRTVTEQVLLSPDAVSAVRSGAVVCDMDTSGLPTARVLDRTYRAAQRAFVSAPVSGSVASVTSGQLLVIAAGSVTTWQG